MAIRPSIFWRFAWRECRRRPLRTALTLLGIVLGVAAVTAVGLGTVATHEGYAGVFRVVAGRADLEAVAPGEAGPLPVPLARLDEVPGVAAVAPIVQGCCALRGPNGPEPLVVLGIDPNRDGAIRDLKTIQNAPAQPGKGLLLRADFARARGLAVGDEVSLGTAHGATKLVVSGLLAPAGSALVPGGALAVVDLATGQELFEVPGQVHAVQATVDRSASRDEVQNALKKLLPGWDVRPAGQASSLAAYFLETTDQALGTLSTLAVIAGALVVINTFLMNLTERRRQLALWRALGATPRQVSGLLARQALILGVSGAAVGLPLGLAMAWVLVRINEGYLGVPLPAVPLDLRWLLFAGLLGPAMTLLATLTPSAQAASRTAFAGSSGRGGPEPPAASWPVVVGVLLLIVVAIWEAAIVHDWVPVLFGKWVMYLIAATCMVGCACLLPAVVPLLLPVAGKIVGPVLGVEGRIAVRQLCRQRTRAGLTAGVLFAAIIVSVSFGQGFLNNLQDIRLWQDRTIDSEFLVRAVPPDPALVLTAASLPAQTGPEVASLPGCKSAQPFRFIPVQLGQQPALVIARGFSPEVRLPMALVSGDPAEARRGLARGEAVVGDALASRLRLGVGDELSLPTRNGPRSVRVAAVVREYTVGGMALYLDWHAGRELFGLRSPHGLLAYAEPGREADLRASLDAYAARTGVLIQSNDDFADQVKRVADGVRGLMVSLVGLIFLVAAVGVVNTLAANVLDQSREIGVMRALGMKKNQVGRVVVAQAVALVLVSAALGVPAGVLLSWMMNRAQPALNGHDVKFTIETVYIACCVLGVSALAVASSLLPARAAARLPVVDALRYE